jgi:hypothetical protein
VLGEVQAAIFLFFGDPQADRGVEDGEDDDRCDREEHPRERRPLALCGWREYIWMGLNSIGGNL